MSPTLTPETRALLEALEGLDLPPLHTLTPSQAREMREAVAGLGAGGEPEAVASTEDRTLDGPDGPLPARIYEPEGWEAGAGGTLAYFHGGGWVLGNLDTHDALCRGLANAASLRVVSVAYRLAPENPHPAALEDAWAATRWVAESADGPLAVGGDSAGGHMAAGVAARARASAVPLVAQLLIYPVTDLSSFGTPSYREFAEGYWLTRASMEWFRDHYLPEGARRDDPDVSPLLRPDLTGMPPTVIVAAECDVLRDEGAAYARRLRDAGCAVDRRLYEGVIHGFMALPDAIPEGRRAIRQAGAALRSLIDARA